jgi:hypothetical protein
VLAVGLLLATGCSQAGGSGDTRGAVTVAVSTPAPDASPTVDGRESKAKDDVLAAYRGYRDAYEQAGRTADAKNPDIAKYTGEPLLGRVLHGLSVRKANGIVTEGQSVSNPTVTSVQLDASPPTADIDDCVDNTNVKAVYQATGKSASAPGTPVKVRITTRAKFVGDRWYIFESNGSQVVPC